MANTKGSALTADTSLGDTDSFIIVDYGVSPITTKRVTYSVLEAAVRDATIITDLAEVTAASTDYLLILDVSASPQALKKVLVSDLLDNATHTGDVTGSSALTIQPEAISGKGEVTASGSDYVLILDTSTSPNSLKKALVSDLGSAFGVSDITGAGAITVAGGDLLVAVDASASPQVLGQVTAQAVADLFDASGYLPLSGGTLTGSIAFAASSPEHTVDGRNVSADGAKLDTIETNADVTDTANVTAAGALMDSEVTNLAQVKAFDSSDYATAAQGATADAALPADGSGEMTGDLVFAEAADHSSTPGAGKGYLWVKSDTPSSLIFTDDAGTDYDLTAAGGGGDLWSDAVDSDIVPTGADSTYDLGTTTDRFAQTYTDAIWITDGDITASVADGASAVAFDFNNTVTLATTGAKLASFKNNGTEKAYIDQHGALRIADTASSNMLLTRVGGTSQIQGHFATSTRSVIALGTGSGYDIALVPQNDAGQVVIGSSGFTPRLTFGAPYGEPAAYVYGYPRGTQDADGMLVYIAGGDGGTGGTGNHPGGSLYLDGGQGKGTSAHGDVVIGSIRGDLVFANDYTVANLPTGVVGKVARVTDASAPAMGSTVSGGGAAAALVWYNGSNWTVIGV